MQMTTIGRARKFHNLFATLARLSLASAALLGAAFAEDKPAVWPQISAPFPEHPKQAPITAERLGAATWEHAPEVISPYEASWYDYVPIMWGSDHRLDGKEALYFAALRKMYFRGAMSYSDDNPDQLVGERMPFYCTNLCNLLYLGNKSGHKAMSGFKKTRGKEFLVREPSLEDPETDRQQRAAAAGIAATCGPHQPLGYDVRDEASYTTGGTAPHDFDFSPTSLASFRQWLKAKYGTLEALNAQWETTFSSWDKVEPLTTDEIQQREFGRMAQMNLSPWADHREYNDDTFIGAVARYRDEVHGKDPGAPVGFSGNQAPPAYGGFDYWKICTTISWVEHYPGQGTRELFRSFLQPKTPAIAAITNAAHQWAMALHGDSGALCWPYNGNDTGHTTVIDVQGETVTLSKTGEDYRAILRDLRGGIPCLLRHGDMRVDPIGVLYSQASIRADWMLEVKRDGAAWINRGTSWEGSHNYFYASFEGVHKALEDMGLQYDCISTQQVVDGDLSRRGIKILFAPRVLALSAKEIDALKAFVENGGVLVTDVMAGRLDEHCRVWKDSPIDGVLGLKRAPFEYQEDKKPETKQGYEGGFGYPIKLTMKTDFAPLKAGEALALQGFHEIGLAAGSAIPLAESADGPALLQNQLGKGTAYTLNFDMPNYLVSRNQSAIDEGTAAHRKIFAALLAKAGVAPKIEVTRPASKAYPVGLETFTYTQGDALYIAVHINPSVRTEIDLSNSGAGVADVAMGPLVVKLPEKGFVTEMRTHKSFGSTDRVEVAMAHNEPVILSVLPYEVIGLKAEVAKLVVDGKLHLSVAIDADGKIGDHVVHAELLDDSGEAIPESVVNLPLAKGSYKGAIDLSFVNETGAKKLRLIDVASGKSAEFQITLDAKPPEKPADAKRF